MPPPQKTPLLIGWRERIDLPEWDIRRLRAKIDTGARTSAIHVENIEYLNAAGDVIPPPPPPAPGSSPALSNGRSPAPTVPDDATRARFDVMLHRRNKKRCVTIEADLVRTSTVRSSHGRPRQRPVVETTFLLAGVERRIQISLVSRRHMLCRMLLGRTALDGDFTVDPAAKYLLTPPRARRQPSLPAPAPFAPKDTA